MPSRLIINRIKIGVDLRTSQCRLALAVNSAGVDGGEIIHNRCIGTALTICRNSVLKGSIYGRQVCVVTHNPANCGILGLPVRIDQGAAEDNSVIDVICLEIGE